MADTHETVTDIIAEMRGMGNYQRYSGDHARVLAGRLEAAYKRERGDAAKLREALEKCANWGEQIDCQLGSSDETVYAFRDERCLAHNISECARAALSAPPRNCDVGTPKEQDGRFHKFCIKHRTGSCAGCCRNPVGDYTVANGIRECALVWAQMPCREGGAE